MCFLSIRWSVSAYASAAALRDEVPVVPPGCIIRHRVAQMQEAHLVVKLLWESALGPPGRTHLEEGE